MFPEKGGERETTEARGEKMSDGKEEKCVERCIVLCVVCASVLLWVGLCYPLTQLLPPSLLYLPAPDE